MGKSKYDPYREIICNGEIPAKKIAEMIGGGCTADHVRAAKQRFLHPKRCQRDKASWRNKHKSQIQKYNKKYRISSRQYAHNEHTDYSTDEEALILSSEEPTIVIAKNLGRSIDAIYRKRVRLRKKAQKM